MKQSLIGAAGYGCTKNVQDQSRWNRAHGFIGDRTGAPQINPNLQTPLTQGFGFIDDKLRYLHGESGKAILDSTKLMFRANPLEHQTELNTRFNNPLAQARLYATDEGRQIDKMVVHGFKSKIVPEGRFTNVQTYADQLKEGLAGEIDQHYNQAMFDKERDL